MYIMYISVKCIRKTIFHSLSRSFLHFPAISLLPLFTFSSSTSAFSRCADNCGISVHVVMSGPSLCSPLRKTNHILCPKPKAR